MDTGSYRIRKATQDDRDAIMTMQEHSIRVLGRVFYPAETIESAIRHIGTMDPDVIDEGHYHIAVDAAGRIVGSGGLSFRIPGYDTHGREDAAAQATPQGIAFIRGVYVHPDWARKGIASSIMAHAEAEAADDGVPALSLMATLSGVPLYRALQYRPIQPKVIRFSDGVLFEGLQMVKRFAATV